MRQTKDTPIQISDSPVGNTDLNKIANEIYLANKEKGFGNRNTNVGEGLMLIVTELGEAMEADRKSRYADIEAFHSKFEGMTSDSQIEKFFPIFFEANIKDTYEDEIADALIRIFDWAGKKGIDLDFHVRQKLRYNKSRPHKHGKKY